MVKFFTDYAMVKPGIGVQERKEWSNFGSKQALWQNKEVWKIIFLLSQKSSPLA